jgi:predicted nucleic acid-binding protein
MTAAFADTTYFLALLNPADELHSEALEFNQGEARPLVTTEFVLTEVGDGLSRPANRQIFARLIDLLRRQPDVEIVPSSSSRFGKACEPHASRKDKNWSLTDCTSFVVMAERSLQDVLTSDHHFQQAGFRPLMLG